MNAGPTQVLAEQFRRLGSSTVFEAGGRHVDAELHRVVPGSRAAGPARTVCCAQGDHLMVHAALAALRPGEVLVITMPEPEPTVLAGELMATQAQGRGAEALLVDGAIRDVDELAELGLPVWTRWVRVPGSPRERIGRLDVPVVVGGAVICPGDIVVLDGDGVAVAGRDHLGQVLESALAREAGELELLERLRDGGLTYDLHGLRDVVEDSGLDRLPIS